MKKRLRIGWHRVGKDSRVQVGHLCRQIVHRVTATIFRIGLKLCLVVVVMTMIGRKGRKGRTQVKELLLTWLPKVEWSAHKYIAEIHRRGCPLCSL